MKFIGFLSVILTGSLLLYAVSDFPAWGDPQSPANRYRVSRHYITRTFEETSVPNMVTAVLADYRGFDTMFETVVIFTAGLAILAVLRLPTRHEETTPSSPGETALPPDLIITTTCRLLIPIIQLFALYVIAHGHHSPGGGFQGGVIFGSSFILYAIGRDLPSALRRFPERKAIALANLGILIYAGIGLLCLLLGSNFLDYGVLHKVLGGTAIEARSDSMLGVEIGVAFTVASIMFLIYANLSSKGSLKRGL